MPSYKKAWAPKTKTGNFHSTYNGPTKASITKSDIKGWVNITTPWNEAFLEDMKKNIQPSSRQWDPTLKVWKINDMFLEDMIILLKLYFSDVVVDLEEDKPTVAPITNLFVEVLKIVPDTYVQRVYEALRFAVHPDHGGTDAQFKELDVAYKERTKK